MKITYFILAMISLFLGCTPSGMKNFARSVTGFDTQSIVMVGESKAVVRRAIQNFQSHYKDDFTFIDKGDTLGYSAQIDALPINACFIFENDINVYQELDVYCSPCAGEMIDGILKDTRYKFKAIDEVNYISTTDLNAVMRLTNPDDNDKSCRQIKVYSK